MDGPLSAYERIVPRGAVVFDTLRPDTVEYAFFGDRLNRRLQPRAPATPVPESAWLLLDEAVETPASGDISIGAGLWLRRPLSYSR
jgi:hypothetical protein